MPVINGVLVAIPAPEDYIVDFDHPKRQSVTASYTISGVGMIISTAFMLQRLYVKRYLRNTLGFDDCKFGLVFFIDWEYSIPVSVYSTATNISVVLLVMAWVCAQFCSPRE